MKRIFAMALTIFLVASGCAGGLDEVRADADRLAARLAELEQQIGALNDQISAIHTLTGQSTVVVGYTPTATGYKLELSDGTTITVNKGAEIDHAQPIYGVDDDGYWIVSVDGGKSFDRMTGPDGLPVTARPDDGPEGPEGKSGITPRLRIDSNGYWQVSLDGGETYQHVTGEDGNPMSAVSGSSYSGFFSDITFDKQSSELVFTTLAGTEVHIPVVDDFSLKIVHDHETEPFLINEKRIFEVEQTGVAEALFALPKGWQAQLTETQLTVTAPATESAGEIKITAASAKGYLRIVSLGVSSSLGTLAWQEFYTKSPDNVLLDFSYAGYNHGETAPPDVATLGYEIFNVCDYGAVADDGKSDRAAFIAAADAVKAKGRGIIYFPEGEFDLHAESDDEKTYSEDIILTMGNFVLKGAGRDKTTILMSAPNIPEKPEIMYNSRVMINIKHNSGLGDLTTVTADAAKGSFEVEVASASALRAGDWVALTLKNNDPELIRKELGTKERFDNLNQADNQIISEGVTVEDFHQIASVSGNTVRFVEPIMHEVEARWGWKIQKYNHYENVGVEDITFRGNAKADFKHHGSWQDDGAYKPINLMRLTNSWMRRVRFVSVSECSSIVSCANVSVYDVEIGGNRGHAAIRSQGSSRVFIGKVIDTSSGPSVSNAANIMDGAGQYHATGVSKQSMGAVLWRNSWGRDSNFESHATQPRATLIDCCRGAFLSSRQGGDANQMPNHLDDLTIWNFNETIPEPGNYIDWWNYSSKYWKFLPPTIVGYAGQVQFEPKSVKRDESHGQNVYPESLYEAQLQNRLGAVPAWLNELK